MPECQTGWLRRWGDGRDDLVDAVKRAKLEPAEPVADASTPPHHRITIKQAKRSTEGGFADVAGMNKQKAALRDAVVLPLQYPRLFKHLGAGASRGVLLYGPPGSGKTHLVKALAAEAGAHLEVRPHPCQGM